MLVHMFYWNKCTGFEFKSSFEIQINLSFKRSRKGKEKEIKEQTQIPAQAARPAPFLPLGRPSLTRVHSPPLSFCFSRAQPARPTCARPSPLSPSPGPSTCPAQSQQSGSSLPFPLCQPGPARQFFPLPPMLLSAPLTARPAAPLHPGAATLPAPEPAPRPAPEPLPSFYKFRHPIQYRAGPLYAIRFLRTPRSPP
jgi:hypothetical protein